MKTNSITIFLVVSFLFCTGEIASQSLNTLPIKYEDLTALQFDSALVKSNFTCIIPFGILEKHGPHLPLGTDLLNARELSLRAASKEYTIIYPQYYFGQINEAKHQPGTIAYSPRVTWDLLQETCDELSRNGVKKIIIVNGHGGNTYFLKYFCQAQLASRKDYVVFLYDPSSDSKITEQLKKMKKTTFDGHAGENETSEMLANRPDLVHLDKASSQNGEDQNRMKNIHNAFTGIWWYAKFPNHYAGNGSPANKELGEFLLNSSADQLAKMISDVKADVNSLNLQKEFFDKAEKPLETKQ